MQEVESESSSCWTGTGTWDERMVGNSVIIIIHVANLHFAGPGMVVPICDRSYSLRYITRTAAWLLM